MSNDDFDYFRYFPDVYNDDGNLVYQCCHDCPFFEKCDCDPYHEGCVMCNPDLSSEQCHSCKCLFAGSGGLETECHEANEQADDSSDDD